MSTGGYQQDQVMLGSGDLLVVFTDGVVEAENEAQTEFGETRLVEYVTTMHPTSAADALRSLMSSVDTFVGRTRQHDDITSLILLVRSIDESDSMRGEPFLYHYQLISS